MRYVDNVGTSEYLKLLGFKRYHYLAWPKGDAERLVLIHGLGEAADVWTAFAARCSAFADIVAVDLRGHGGTPWDPDVKYRISDYVEDLVLQLRHWNTRCVLVGHQLGAWVATGAAKELPDLVRGLVRINPSMAAGGGQTMSEALSGQRHGSTGGLGGSDTLLDTLTWARPGGGRIPKYDPVALEAGQNIDLAPSTGVLPTPVLEVGDTATASSLGCAPVQPTVVRSINGRWPHIESPGDLSLLVQEFIAGIPR